ncbi:MAG: hypothetical protein Q4D23_02175 [Bacteroidales bacterium]|nr:hypothetical protein [Bacteroidales bacterium]
MKIFITSLILLCSATAAMAQEVADTITIDKPEKVVITQNDKSLSVTVDGLPDDSNFHLERSIALADSTSSSSFVSVDKHDGFSWDFGAAEKNNAQFTIQIPSEFELGFTTAVGGPADLKTGFFKSGEINVGLMRFNFVPARGPWTFFADFGISTSALRLRGDRRFVPDADPSTCSGPAQSCSILPYPTDAAKDKRSTLFSVGGNVRLMARYSIGKYDQIGFGAMWNFPALNIGEFCRTSYTDADGQKHTAMHMLNTQRSGFAFQVEYLPMRNVKFFVKYAPWSNVNKQVFGKNFGTFTAGLGFTF